MHTALPIHSASKVIDTLSALYLRWMHTKNEEKRRNTQQQQNKIQITPNVEAWLQH